MTTLLFEASWRVYPAALLMAAGIVVLIYSVRRGFTDGRRITRDPARAFAIMRAFRVGIVGLCVAGIGAGWCWHVPALIGLSLIIVGEEVLESSVFIAALRDEMYRRRNA
jgi:hypothetical protein